MNTDKNQKKDTKKPEQKKEEKPKVKRSSFEIFTNPETGTEFIIEEIIINEIPLFLMFNKEQFLYDEKNKIHQQQYQQSKNYLEGKTKISPKWGNNPISNNYQIITHIENTKPPYGYIKPIIDDHVKAGGVLLPDCALYYENEEILLNEIKEFIHTWLDIPEDMEIIASHYILMSWVYDQFNTLCYLRALGDFGSGKSRYLDVIGGLCYKPINIAGALTTASVFRLLEKWRGTLIIDEGDWSKRDEQSDIIKILNVGFSKGTPIVRVDRNDNDNIQSFRVYGPKIISSRQSFTDKALESRCLTTVMQRTGRQDLPIGLDSKFFKKRQELRNKLLYWRLKHISHNQGKDIENEEEDPILKKSLEPRLRQVTQVLLRFLVYVPGVKEKFIQYMVEYSKRIKQERSESNEGLIANIILKHIVGEIEVPLTNKWIADKMIEDHNMKNFTPRRVSSTVRVLGLKTKSIRIGGSVHRIIQINGNEKQRLWQEYYLEEESEEVTNVTNVTLLRETLRHDNEYTNKDTTIQSFDKKEKSEGVSSNVVTTVTPVTKKPPKIINPDDLLELILVALETLKVDKIASEDIQKLSQLDNEQLDQMMKELNSKGLIFEPRPGFWKLL